MTAIRLEIHIEGPILTAGHAPAGYGIDTGFQRDLSGAFVLPGTLVKGVVVHTLNAISEAAPDKLPAEKIGGWFGCNTGDVRDLAAGEPRGETFLEPRRGIVRFGDLRLKREAAQAEPARLTRIAVDDGTGSVRRGMLQVLESPLAYGETGVFAGTLTVLDTADEAAEIARWIEKALHLVPGLGSAKSAGFGHIAKFRASVAEDDASASETPAAGPRLQSEADAVSGERIVYALEFAEPLLVASQAISGNLFKSSEEIPGGVVKGALARVIKAGGLEEALGAALDQMIIRHAKPVMVKQSDTKSAARPQAVPLSLFSVETFDGGNAQLDDIKDASDPDADGPEFYGVLGGAVLFSPDWKSKPVYDKAGRPPPWKPLDWKGNNLARRTVRDQLNHTADFKQDVRTRTAIKNEEGVAAESQLFSRIALLPGADLDPETQEARRHAWAGEIACGGADPAAFMQIAQIMQKGLPGIGKTGATAAVSFFKPDPASPGQATLRPGAKSGYCRWRIVLETDAQLHGPRAVFCHRHLGPEARLNAQYRDYFADAINQRGGAGAVAVAPDDLELRFFARQRWAGGYQALRFPGVENEYYPHLVTEAGSVFVLDAPQHATPAIESFVRLGLPLPSTVPAKDREFKRSPFVPQNGYGEVSIGDYFEWQRLWAPDHA